MASLACSRSIAVAGWEKRIDRQAKPKKGKVEAKRPFARESPEHPVGKVRDLEKRLAEG